MRVISILAVAVPLLVSHACALAQQGLRSSASMQTWGYFNSQAPARDSHLNPDNGVLRVAPDQFVLDARLNMRIASEALDLVLQPRLLAESRENGSGQHNRAAASVRQAFARASFGDGATLTVGRHVMAWGPANFRSPSSSFYFDSGKLNPLREVPGIDLVRLEQVSGRYSLALGHVLDAPAGHRSDAPRTSFLKLDYQAPAFLASANVAKRNGRKPFFGAYGQLQWDDAVMLYSEYGYGQRASALVIGAEPRPPLRLEAPAASAASFLIGASYTRLNGEAVSVEYLHDRHGYTGDQQDAYTRALEQSARMAASADAALRERGLGALGLAAAKAPGLLGRNYVSLLWQSNPQESAQYWRVSATFNVHDASGQISGFYEHNLSPTFSVFVNAMRNVGPANSEFRLAVAHVLTLGIKAFIF